MTEFEVGKIYRHTQSYRTIKVLYVSKNNMIADVLSGTNEGNDEWFSPNTKDWREYKEPRKIEGWVNVFGGPNGLKLGDVNWDSKSSAIACGGKRVDYIDTIKISYTEGE